MAYVLLLDELERQAIASYTVTSIARALGADVSVTDPAQVRGLFDDALAAEPELVDPTRQALLVELGLREA